MKILGLIGLVLLAIVLAVLLLLIFLLVLPWRIRGKALFYDDIRAELKASSFFTFARAKVSFDGSLKIVVSVLFGLIKIVNETIDFKIQSKAEHEEEVVREEAKKAQEESVTSEASLEHDVESKTEREDNSKKPEKKERRKKKSSEDKEKKFGFGSIKEILNDTNKRGVKKLLFKLKKMIGYFHFSLKGTQLDFGFDDPSMTGKITGIMSLFPFTMSKNVRITPHFEYDSTKVNGQIRLKGSIILVRVLILILSIYKDKEIMGLFKAGGEDNGKVKRV